MIDGKIQSFLRFKIENRYSFVPKAKFTLTPPKPPTFCRCYKICYYVLFIF